ncbi:MAG: tRNA dimethylallyltransferase, partial [Pseudomonadota bacterium]|nr:tRNA dimethylallyltransferase [Pseudomonadota bacterium]
PAFRAIGVPELVDHLHGHITLDEARSRASIATRQFAKRQRTWFRSKMRHWHGISPNG